MSLAYYMGLPYKVNVENRNGLYEAWIEELGRDVNGVGSTEEEAKRNCQDAKHAALQALVKSGAPIPEPINKNSYSTYNEQSQPQNANQPQTEEIKYLAHTPKEQEVIDLLSELFTIKTVKYKTLNSVIPFNEKVDKLRQLKEKYPDLVIAREGTDEEGITVLSLIATITKFLYGRALAFNVDGPDDEDLDDEWIITGVKFYEDN